MRSSRCTGPIRSARGALVEQAVATLKDAWTGEPFEFDGAPALVNAPPDAAAATADRPRGSSPGAARRAARIADGFMPSDPALMEHYMAEKVRLGQDPGSGDPGTEYWGTVALIAEDVEAGWAAIGEYCMHEDERLRSLVRG